MKIWIVIAVCLLSAAACKQKTSNTDQDVKVQKSKQKVFIDKTGVRYNAFIDIPADHRTPEQKIFTESLTDILINGIAAESNHMVLKFSKQECLARGMKEEDYDELQRNLADNNRHFDSIGNKDVPKMIDDMHQDMKAYKAGGYQTAKR